MIKIRHDVDVNISIGAIVLGGAIAVAIVWLATRSKEQKESPAVEASKRGVTRAVVSNN